METVIVFDKDDEITDLEVAYDALKGQPRDAQVRMLAWLDSRLRADFEADIDARIENEKKRRAENASPIQQEKP